MGWINRLLGEAPVKTRLVSELACNGGMKLRLEAAMSNGAVPASAGHQDYMHEFRAYQLSLQFSSEKALNDFARAHDVDPSRITGKDTIELMQFTATDVFVPIMDEIEAMQQGLAQAGVVALGPKEKLGERLVAIIRKDVSDLHLGFTKSDDRGLT
jgi:hypothetical protein